MAKVIRLTENQFGEMMGYHGAGADFDKFNHRKFLSTGAGSQAFGWGTYITSDVHIANGYAAASTKNGCIKDFVTCLEKGYTMKDILSRQKKDFFLEAFKRKYLRLFINCGLDVNQANHGCKYLWNTLIKSKFKKTTTAKNLKNDYIRERQKAKGFNDDFKGGVNRRIRGFSAFRVLNVGLDVINASIYVLDKLEIYEDGNKILYEVNIPDDNGQNYIDWFEKVEGEKASRISNFISYLQQRFRIEFDASFYESLNNGQFTGEMLYRYLANRLCSMKAASLCLLHSGFVGIKYLAGTRWIKPQGAADDACNYVIFDANNIKIVNKTKA